MKIKTRRILTIIVILVYIVGCFFIVRSLSAEECVKNSSCQPKISHKNQKYYKKQIKIHRKRGKRNWFAAKDKVWKIHQPFIREKAKQIVNVTIASFPTDESRAKIVAAILLALTQNGIGQVHEWRFIQKRLQLAKFHYEQVDFYKALLHI